MRLASPTSALVMGLASLAAACSAPREIAEARPLGMNDATILLPLPASLAAPVLASITGAGSNGDAAPLVPRALYETLVAAPGDIAPKTGQPVAFEDYHVVAVRFDLCEREVAGPCAEGADGRVRLVLQPLYPVESDLLAHDLALHAFYPIPAAELPAVISELRALARIQDAPVGAPLSVSPALSAQPPPEAYAPRLRALVLAYARADRLVKLTVFGQNAQSAAFAWRFRGVDMVGGAPERIAIPGAGSLEQTVLIAGGDTVYNTAPLADAPAGFALALNGMLFAAATPAERSRSLEALAEVLHPARHDANDVQCASCHVATFLTTRRAAAAGVDPAAIAGAYTSSYNTAVDSIITRDARVLRALGWAARFPAISMRVAHDTAQVLAEIEQRFPPRD